MLILGILIGIAFTLVMGLCAAASDNEARIEMRNAEELAKREETHANSKEYHPDSEAKTEECPSEEPGIRHDRGPEDE